MHFETQMQSNYKLKTAYHNILVTRVLPKVSWLDLWCTITTVTGMYEFRAVLVVLLPRRKGCDMH